MPSMPTSMTSPPRTSTTASTKTSTKTSTTAATLIHHPLPSTRRLPRLSRTGAFYLQASIILFFLAGSSAPTPLYGVYQAAWGFSPITITVVFGIYAIAVLATLLVVGGLSDYVGRRPVLLAAALLQAISMAIFATANDVGALVLARVVKGLSTGAAAAAV